mgnify:CR=1 FL=1
MEIVFGILVAIIIWIFFYWIGGFLPMLKNSRYRIAVPAIIIGITINLLIILND